MAFPWGPLLGLVGAGLGGLAGQEQADAQNRGNRSYIPTKQTKLGVR